MSLFSHHDKKNEVNADKKNMQMKLDTENLAMPEIHVMDKENESDDIAEDKNNNKYSAKEMMDGRDNEMQVNCDDEDDKDDIDFSGAIPEIHMHKKHQEK